MTIINLQQEDRGTYLCSATNEAATITAEAELLVENTPSNAPYNLTAVAGMTSVHLIWSSPTQQHSDFSVWYKTPESTEWKTMKVANKRKLEATVGNLNPGREYEFVVFSQDKNGNGLFSKAVRVWTKGIDGEADRLRGRLFPPVGFPRNVTLHRTVDGFLLTWEPPEYGLELLKFYKIKWTQGPDDVLYGMAETKNTSYFVPALEDGYDYDFQVFAVSTDGQESPTEKITLNLPGYVKMKTVSTAVVAGFAFIAVAFVGIYFAKKKWHRHEKESLNNSQKK